MRRPLPLLTQAFPGRAALDTAASRALLALVAEGLAPETLRLYRPDAVMAFSGLDATQAGFAEAARAARSLGFAPVLRLAGGRAAVFHAETLAFAWSVPIADPRVGIAERFDALAALVARALRRLGVDAHVGEVPGEYCPGAHSVNAGGRRKLMGVGQRVVRGAAHVGGVIVVRDAARVREGLAAVYGPLGYAFDPEAAGAIEDEVPGVTRDDVVAALLAELADDYDVVPSEPDAAWLARAAEWEARHAVPEAGQPAGVAEGRDLGSAKVLAERGHGAPR